jgi:hypothetical protein
MTQKKCEWIYPKTIDSNGSITSMIVQTGIIDRRPSFPANIFISSEVWLHPPRSRDFRYSELLPFPWVKFPIELGQEIEWDLTPKDGWKELEGVEVTGKLKVTDKIYCDFPAVKDSCWVIDITSTCSIGSFSGQYYYHEKIGFVYFYYDFNSYDISLKLHSLQKHNISN